MANDNQQKNNLQQNNNNVFDLNSLSPDERTRIAQRMRGVLRSLEKLGIEDNPDATGLREAGCTCTCDCDPWDPATTKASFHFGKNFADLN